MTGIAHGWAAVEGSPSGTGAVCAAQPQEPDAARLIIFLSSDHFMIMLGALVTIFATSLHLLGLLLRHRNQLGVGAQVGEA